MASTGDSITRAFNTCSFPFVDCPAQLVVDRLERRRQQPLPPHPRCEPGDRRPQLQRCPHGGTYERAQRSGRHGCVAGRRVRDDPDGRQRRLHVECLDSSRRPRRSRRQFQAAMESLTRRAAERAHLRRQHPGRLPPMGDPAHELQCSHHVVARAGSASRCLRTRGRTLRPMSLDASRCVTATSPTTPPWHMSVRSSLNAASTGTLPSTCGSSRRTCRLATTSTRQSRGRRRRHAATWAATFNFAEG